MDDKLTIIFNYKKAIQEANDLMEVSNNIRKIATGKLNESIQAIDSNWEGENSIKFITKSRMLQKKIENSADYIEIISDSIKEMAKNIYNTEMENIQIAETRTS